jgi:hypothetical protein
MLPVARSRFARSALVALLLIAAPLPASASLRAVVQDEEEKEKKKDKKSKKDKNKVPSNAPAESGTPMLWQDRGDVSSLDLYWGIGSEAGAPKAPFTFDKEDTSGTNPKIKVIDANGVKWNVKFDEEVHAEVAASRIVWAAGYMVEESYFLRSAKVNGVTGLGRAKKFVGSDGSIANAMFEKRPDTIARRRINWDWGSNPFRGTKELSGLAILCAMLNNWDAKTTNNNVLGMFADDRQTVYDWYVVADWGGTFGKMGGVFSHSKWDLDAFNKQGFVEGVSGGTLRLNYSGKGGSALKSVPLEHARWFAGIVGQLSDEQLRAAFRAAGATDAEVQGFSARLRQKIEELERAVAEGQVAA